MTTTICDIETRAATDGMPELRDSISPSSARAVQPRRVLIVSYVFPPVGGAGVQRVTKFVKYLSQFGWLPSVLTVANPSVPLQDPSLLADIPPETIIRKAKTSEPGYGVKLAVADTEQTKSRSGSWKGMLKQAGLRLAKLALQPDPQILWLPHALREGRRLLAEVPHAAILASGPPFSSFLLAARLHKLTGLPLILDYRDEWNLSTAYLEHKGNDALSRFVQERMQRSVVRSATALVATTQASANALEEIRRQSGGKAPVRCIYNGYDADDFRAEPAPSTSTSDSIFRLVYVGTLWNLTSAEALVAAIKQFCREAPKLAARLELVVAGRSMPTQNMLLDQLKETPCRLVRHEYLAHAQAVSLMCSADALCVLLADVPGAERVMPAKVFEYLATGRPILTIAPRGEVWQVLQDYPAAACFAPSEASAVSRWLADQVQRKMLGPIPGCSAWNAARFSRRQQAGELAGLLTDAVDAHRDS